MKVFTGLLGIIVLFIALYMPIDLVVITGIPVPYRIMTYSYWFAGTGVVMIFTSIITLWLNPDIR